MGHKRNRDRAKCNSTEQQLLNERKYHLDAMCNSLKKQLFLIEQEYKECIINEYYPKFKEKEGYLCEKHGINFKTNEESYTSKCSFLDNEEITKHEVYLGKRIKRGLFQSSANTIINADVNGSYNILKKAVPNAFVDGIEGVAVHPYRVNL